VRSPLTPLWPLPPTDLTLQSGEVHLWRSPLTLSAEQRDRYWQTLSPDERLRADRYRFPQHRQRAIAARGILRALLGRYLAQDPAQLSFAYTPQGKPFLPHSPRFPSLEFNLSHSEDLMLCAVALNHAVGIDLEQIRPLSDLSRLTQRFFAPSEHQAIQALGLDQQPQAFFQYWTVKEAILKAIAHGIGGLETVELAFDQGQPQIIRAPALDPSTRWDVRLLVPEVGFIGAIAAPVSQFQPRFLQWQP
jgi:4'-phosphopantetheinyl transferase